MARKKSASVNEISVEELKQQLRSNSLSKGAGEVLINNLTHNLGDVAEYRRLQNIAKTEEEFNHLLIAQNIDRASISRQIEIHDLLLQNPKILRKLLKNAPQSDKIRTSGHYWDSKLKYSKPAANSNQTSLFDLLEKPSTKAKIKEVDYAVSHTGIDLSTSQNKLMSALIKILHDKSEHHDMSSDQFYQGNYKPVPISDYGGTGKEVKAPTLRFKPAELYKAYLDKKDYSGQEIRFIKGVLESIANKKFLIRYERKKKVEKNGKTQTLTDLIEDFQPLVKIVNYIPDLTDEEVKMVKSKSGNVHERKGEYLIALNPILVDQITTKYVEFPRDIERRTIQAAGGHNAISQADIALRDYFLREISSKRYRCEIGSDKLPYLLKLGGYIRNRRPKVVKERIDKAIAVCKTIGLLKEAEVELTAKKQTKYIFHLNSNFS